jgi:ABC-type phosphate transport system substrate-binding protein
VRADLPKALRAAAFRLAALLILVGCAQAHAQSAQIIVNPSVEAASLDRERLRAIFTMRMTAWPNGPPIRVFVLPDRDPVSDLFYREQLGMYSYVLRAVWDRMVFTGTGLAPTLVRSEEEMRARVRATPGAIGYVSKRSDAPSLRLPMQSPLLYVGFQRP